jgi:hypothetical protein
MPIQEEKHRLTSKELWEEIKPYALMDEDFIRRLDDHQIQGASWKIIKWIFAAILGTIMLYAPAKVVEWFNNHITFNGK